VPAQNIDLGSTTDVTFNGQQVDFLYLDSTLIWQRISQLAILTESSTATSPDPLLTEAGEELETES
jgi:hypothetical protein